MTRIAWISLEDGRRFEVRDISFGGLALYAQKSQFRTCLDADQAVPITLHLFHRKVKCRIRLIHQRGGVVGCMFPEADQVSSEFLRDVLPLIHAGNSLVRTSLDEVADDLWGGQWERFQGDNNVSLALHRDLSGEVDRCELTFRMNGVSNQLTYREGCLNYIRVGDPESSQFLALEQGFFVIVGFLEFYRDQGLEILAEVCKETIDMELSGPAHTSFGQS